MLNCWVLTDTNWSNKLKVIKMPMLIKLSIYLKNIVEDYYEENMWI